MSERDDRYAGTDPSSTAAFRAAPDISASTAQFKAFASGADSQPELGRPGSAWPEQPWAGAAPSSGSRRSPALIIGVIIAVVLVVVVVGYLAIA